MVAGASVWGGPAYLRSWEMTRAALEGLAGRMHHHPVILDDTRRNAKPEDVGLIVYDIVSGQGRARGTPSGTRRTETFRSLLISSGESPLRDMLQSGGLPARVIHVPGNPLGAKTPENGALASLLRSTCEDHYGHVGEAVMTWLQGAELWQMDGLRRYFAMQVAHFAEVARLADVRSEVLSRQVQKVAVLQTAGAMAERALGKTPMVRWITDSEFVQIARASSVADRSIMALREVMEWVTSTPARVYHADRKSGHIDPQSGYIAHKSDAQKAMTLFPGPVKRYLTEAGYASKEVITAWKEKGWLQRDGAYQVRMPDGFARGYRFTLAALVESGVVEDPDFRGPVQVPDSEADDGGDVPF